MKRLFIIAIVLACSLSAQAGIFITEYMYRAALDGTGSRNREFFELTNTGPDPVDMAGWSFDDDKRIPHVFDLSAFGTVMPGESVIVTEITAAVFRQEWGLDPSVKVIGNLGNPVGNNLGRNDEINIYDNNGNLVDRFTYGDESFPGSIRTDAISGWVTNTGLGANNPFEWVLSAVGDMQGSLTAQSGDVGSPGIHVMGDIPDPERNIIINELMYNPPTDNQDEEYLELFNRGTEAVDLSGWYFSSGITFTFPEGTILGPGEYLVVCSNTDLITALYSIINVIGNYEGRLSNSGELIQLNNAMGAVIDQVCYSDTIP